MIDHKPITKIESLEDLQNLEGAICTEIQKFKLEELLITLPYSEHNNITDYPAFIIPAMALFAIRFCTAGHKRKNISPNSSKKIKRLIHLVTSYQLADPLGFDKSVQNMLTEEQNYVLDLLRIASNQARFMQSTRIQLRSFDLFLHIPEELSNNPEVRIPQYNVRQRFSEITGIELEDFIKVGLIAYTAAANHRAFMGDYFRKARESGIKLPEDRIIANVVNRLAADPKEAKQHFETRKNQDRRYAAYDFNPLQLKPLIRPWRMKGKAYNLNADHLIAPAPALIIQRITQGIFYDLFNRDKTKFSDWFGHVFENYTGKLLNYCSPNCLVVSENQIRKTYPTSKGKAVDWVIVEEDFALLIDCKSSRLSLPALRTGNKTEVDKSFKSVRSGLKQAKEFQAACEDGKEGLEIFHGVKQFKTAIITLESFYVANSRPFQEMVNSDMSENKIDISQMDWIILSVEQLEQIEPFISAGWKWCEVFELLHAQEFESVMNYLQENTERMPEEIFTDLSMKIAFEKLGIEKIMEEL